MKNKNESGFSLIELIIVMVIIGILAVLTFPYASRAKNAAEKTSIGATLKTMLTAQTNYYTRNSRYARLDELNASQYGALGTNVGTDMLSRGNFTFEMIPTQPTDAELREGFTIKATKPAVGGDPPIVITITHNGYTDRWY